MTVNAPSKTILIIEDDRDVRSALALMLADEGFRVLTVPDGFDALSSLEGHRPDVIVLDWMMPVVDGSQFITALRAEYNLTTPVLVITAGRVNRAEALAAGADDYLEKPFDLDDLVNRIRTLADRPSETKEG